MELKLVDAKPLSNELIDAFYQNLEQQQKDAERVEELEYNASKTIVTRRKFLQYTGALGAVGLGLSLGMQRAEAGGLHSWEIEEQRREENFIIRPKKVIVDQDYLRAGEPAQGRIIVSNETNEREYNKMVLRPIASRSLRDSKNAYCHYEVPSFTELVFEFFNGPWAIPYRKTKINILASNEYARKKSRGLTLYA